MKTELTQSEKVLKIMVTHPEVGWWHCEDLMQFGDTFVGYKAQARISELAHEYPKMIEQERSEKNVRQYRYRVRFESVPSWIDTLPTQLRTLVAGWLRDGGRTAYAWRTSFEVDEATRTARPVRKLVAI
jgi:hypothetical protein